MRKITTGETAFFITSAALCGILFPVQGVFMANCEAEGSGWLFFFLLIGYFIFLFILFLNNKYGMDGEDASPMFIYFWSHTVVTLLFSVLSWYAGESFWAVIGMVLLGIGICIALPMFLQHVELLVVEWLILPVMFFFNLFYLYWFQAGWKGFIIYIIEGIRIIFLILSIVFTVLAFSRQRAAILQAEAEAREKAERERREAEALAERKRKEAEALAEQKRKEAEALAEQKRKEAEARRLRQLEQEERLRQEELEKQKRREIQNEQKEYEGYEVNILPFLDCLLSKGDTEKEYGNFVSDVHSFATDLERREEDYQNRARQHNVNTHKSVHIK